MKKGFEPAYWLAMVVVMALIFQSILGEFSAALFLSAMLLPGILFVKIFGRGLSLKNRQGLLHAVYLVLIVLLIEYQAILTVYWVLYGFAKPPENNVLLNPVFIWFVLASLLAIEALLKMRFFPTAPEEKYIAFTSGRQKISLEIDSILCVESRDYEVLVRTDSGRAYPTRMKISQWESVLDRRFIRVHRSFIVNRKHITQFDARCVRLGDLSVEISRKYKNAVAAQLKEADA